MDPMEIQMDAHGGMDAQMAEAMGSFDPDIMEAEEMMAMFEGSKEALKEKLIDADFYNEFDDDFDDDDVN